MRIAIDPIPLVLGIYAHVGQLLKDVAQQQDNESVTELVNRYAKRRGEGVDREVQRIVRKLHADVKTADKLLRKTSNIWKISRETDLVNLTIRARGGDEPDPEAYVLLQPAEIRALLGSIYAAAQIAREDEETLTQLQKSADALEARPDQYLAFGFDPWDD